MASKKLTKKERENFIKQMIDYMPDDKNENYHIECDMILIAVLKKLGETEIVEAYNKAEQRFWYS